MLSAVQMKDFKPGGRHESFLTATGGLRNLPGGSVERFVLLLALLCIHCGPAMCAVGS